MSATEAPHRPVVLVMAKAPVPGFAKTRLARDLGPVGAAEIAAAALLDTLEAVRELGSASVVALAGDVRMSVRRSEIERALAGHLVIKQRGVGLGDRIARAHLDSARLTGADAVVQVGMDTPQLTPGLLGGAIRALAGVEAALGPASDGGWWCLGARDAALASCLVAVPMSRADTGRRTEIALTRSGARVSQLPELRDVDTLPDAFEVAELIPQSRFARAVAQCAPLCPGSLL